MNIERLEMSPDNFRRLQVKAISLQSELDEAESQLNDMRDAFLKDERLWPLFKLSPTQSTIFALLMRRDFATKPMLYTAIYDHRPDCDQRAQKIVDVQLHFMRRKLNRFGIVIENIWGQGYQITAEMKERVRELMCQAVPFVASLPVPKREAGVA